MDVKHHVYVLTFEIGDRRRDEFGPFMDYAALPNVTSPLIFVGLWSFKKKRLHLLKSYLKNKIKLEYI